MKRKTLPKKELEKHKDVLEKMKEGPVLAGIAGAELMEAMKAVKEQMKTNPELAEKKQGNDAK